MCCYITQAKWYTGYKYFLFKVEYCSAVLRRPIRGAGSGEASDSEEELAAFCPTVSLSMFQLECHSLRHIPPPRPNSPPMKPHFNSLDPDFYLYLHQIEHTHKHQFVVDFVFLWNLKHVWKVHFTLCSHIVVMAMCWNFCPCDLTFTFTNLCTVHHNMCRDMSYLVWSFTPLFCFYSVNVRSPLFFQKDNENSWKLKTAEIMQTLFLR